MGNKTQRGLNDFILSLFHSHLYQVFSLVKEGEDGVTRYTLKEEHNDTFIAWLEGVRWKRVVNSLYKTLFHFTGIYARRQLHPEFGLIARLAKTLSIPEEELFPGFAAV